MDISKERALMKLRELRTNLVNARDHMKRKRAPSPSEKAMALADVAEKIAALDIAIECVIIQKGVDLTS